MNWKELVGLALLCTSSARASADVTPICADRPGKATSTCTVPAGHWQVETGLADWALDSNGGARDISLVIGETTVKYGLTDRSDIEVDVTPWQRATSRAGGVHDSASGVGDLVALYKQQLTPTDAAVQVTVKPFVKAPTAKRSLGNRKWEGGLLVPIGFAIPKSTLSFGLTPEVDWVADADRRGHHAAMVQVATLGWQATAKLNLSGEIWGRWDWDPAGTTRQASVDGAVAYLVRSDLQLDAGVNVGLNRVTPDVDLYAGIAKQF